MPKQLHNTLISLGQPYQDHIAPEDYEVIVVENHSTELLDSSNFSEKYGDNFHYHLHHESGVSPVNAINLAFEKCRGKIIGLLIDGARMITPNVLSNTKKVFAMSPEALVAIPGYHIGKNEQHLASPNYSVSSEQALLASLDWENDGYKLFTISTFSGANSRGFLQPMMECNCIFFSAESFRKIGQADTRFTLRGGGAINLHIYRSLGMLPEMDFYVLPGEGSFHQFHGGVTTSASETRKAELQAFQAQLDEIWNNQFHGLRRNPILLGDIDSRALPFAQQSIDWSLKRASRLTSNGKALWPDDKPVH